MVVQVVPVWRGFLVLMVLVEEVVQEAEVSLVVGPQLSQVGAPVVELGRVARILAVVSFQVGARYLRLAFRLLCCRCRR